MSQQTNEAATVRLPTTLHRLKRVDVSTAIGNRPVDFLEAIIGGRIIRGRTAVSADSAAFGPMECFGTGKDLKCRESTEDPMSPD